MLNRCQELDQALVPFLAVQLFGGLRPVEARALTWAEVKAGHIEVTAAKSKTRARRLVTINDTLRAWLAAGGDLPAGNWQRRLARVRGGMGWPHDCLRHSFVSYAVPVLGVSRTALEAGHSEAVLVRHYRELVTAEDAGRFWGLRPKV